MPSPEYTPPGPDVNFEVYHPANMAVDPATIQEAIARDGVYVGPVGQHNYSGAPTGAVEIETQPDGLVRIMRDQVEVPYNHPSRRRAAVAYVPPEKTPAELARDRDHAFANEVVATTDWNQVSVPVDEPEQVEAELAKNGERPYDMRFLKRDIADGMRWLPYSATPADGRAARLRLVRPEHTAAVNQALEASAVTQMTRLGPGQRQQRAESIDEATAATIPRVPETERDPATDLKAIGYLKSPTARYGPEIVATGIGKGYQSSERLFVIVDAPALEPGPTQAQ